MVLLLVRSVPECGPVFGRRYGTGFGADGQANVGDMAVFVLAVGLLAAGEVAEGRERQSREREKGRKGERAGHPRSPVGEMRAFPAAMLLLEKLPLLALVAASAVFTFLNQRWGGSVIALQSIPISQRMLRAAALYVDYLAKTLWPANLAIYADSAPVKLLPAPGGPLYWPRLQRP